MSEHQEGPGWWKASNGRWYPPAEASSTPPPPPPPPPGPAIATGGADEGQSLPARAWRRFRSWPTWVQVISGVVVLAVLAAPFTGQEDEPAPTSSERDEATADEEGSEEATATTRATTTTTEPPTTTTTEPPTTTTALPPPVTYSGSGSQVLSIDKPAEVVLATISGSGSSNFAIWALDGSMTQTDLLVNTIGSYSGTVLIDADTSGTQALEIESNGPWTIELKVLGHARTFDSAIDGTGDDVVAYTGPAGVAQISHQGTSNFAIWYHHGDGTDLVVNEIGTVSGGYRWADGPGIAEISADGPWQIAVG